MEKICFVLVMAPVCQAYGGAMYCYEEFVFDENERKNGKGTDHLMQLEVCVDSLESATNAIYNGADELEVCRNLAEGGLTPSVEMVKQIIDMVNLFVASQDLLKKPKLNIMIRCREGWDFCYNEVETDRMLREVFDFKSLNIDSFVFGALTKLRDVDVVLCTKIIAQAYPKPVYFHRAYDQTRDPIAAMEDLIGLGIKRVLTSGQRDSAADNEAIKLIAKLLTAYGKSIEIMPGAGINAKNSEIFTQLGCRIIHGSFKRKKVSLDGLTYVTDGELVKKVKSIINNK